MASKLLGKNRPGLLFIISAPAGTGKTTLIGLLKEEFDTLVQSISYTTRAPRPEEVEGIDYHFIDDQTFQKKIARGDFLEYAQLYGQSYYGTSAAWVNDQLRAGKDVVLVIDTQGALQLMGKVPLVSIFIAPPSVEELEHRLVKRQTESPEAIAKRLAFAEQELQKSVYYDYLVMNDELDVAYEILRSIFIAEGHRVKKNHD